MVSQLVRCLCKKKIIMKDKEQKEIPDMFEKDIKDLRELIKKEIPMPKFKPHRRDAGIPDWMVLAFGALGGVVGIIISIIQYNFFPNIPVQIMALIFLSFFMPLTLMWLVKKEDK